MTKKKHTFHIKSDLTRKNINSLYNQFHEQFDKEELREIDLNRVEKIDSSGVAFLEYIQENSEKAELTALSPKIKAALNTFSTPEESKKSEKQTGFFEKLGEKALLSKNSFISGLYLTSDIFYWSIKDLFNTNVRQKNSVVNQCIAIGVNAVGIIALLSFILGLILALQSSAQLSKFGANIYVADLIGFAMVREMGPMMTAILVAGRSGSSFASEIGTMKISEELDALRAMGINPLRFLVVPKFIGITIVMPLLSTLSTILGILAGLIVSVYYLKISAYAYLYELFDYITLEDEIIGLSKSLFFAWVIIIIGVYYGLKVEGGSEGVGKATTKSVVASIFAVIVLDAFFSLFYLV